MSESVKFIPEDYHSINPYLVVRNADRAIEFYKKAFGAEERFRMHRPDGKAIMHAELKIGDSVFMLTEESPDMKALSPESIGGSPISLYVYVKDVDGVFNQAVSEGATVTISSQRPILWRPFWILKRSIWTFVDNSHPQKGSNTR